MTWRDARRFRTAGLIHAAATSIVLLATDVTPAATCFSSPGDAARSFVRSGIEEPRRSVDVLDAKSLNRFRARLEQLLDDRYSPLSAELRDRVFSPDSSPTRLRTMSDAEFVGRYFAAGQRQGGKASVADIAVLSTRDDRFLGTEVTVSYRARTTAGESVRQRSLFASSASGCWRLEVPLEAWARLDEIAKVFKEARPSFVPTQGKPRVRLLVARASESPESGLQQLKLRGNPGAGVWVSTAPLLTEADIVGARASWDCEAGLGPEDASVMVQFNDDGARRLKEWSEGHIGSMLALAVDGEVVTFARVATVLGNKLSMCLRGESLEDAQRLADSISGASR